MEIDGSTFVPQSGYFFLIWVKVSKKFDFFLILFEPILQAGFFDKMLALSNTISTFVLVSGFLGVAFSRFCPNRSDT